jgi:ppGpp synthetase/RelA/SpoT-type nucleotidyltranferase
MEYPNLEQDFAQIPPQILTTMAQLLTQGLEQCGLYYRLFTRTKTAASTRSKLLAKQYPPGKKMQDLFGIRIATYFQDDQAICRRIIEDRFSVVSVTEDRPDPNTFSPTRLNLICKLPLSCRQAMPGVIYQQYPIDSTVEIQLRTVFSEGWHEVEHDLRYKAKDDWKGSEDLSRALNGIFATLITCDWSMLNIFDDLVYRKYREKDWTAMLKNKLRIHVAEPPLSQPLRDLLTGHPELAAELYQLDRSALLDFLSDTRFHPPEKTLDNLVFLMNELFMHNPAISALTPEALRQEVASCARKR